MVKSHIEYQKAAIQQIIKLEGSSRGTSVYKFWAVSEDTTNIGQCGLHGSMKCFLWSMKRLTPYDCYAIAARKRVTGCIVKSTVGHLPKEIPRVTWFILLYGAVVKVKVLDTHPHRSPLVQGGLEIPIQVIVKMECKSQNKDALTRCEALVNQFYKEPVDGKFEDVTATIVNDIDFDTDEETVSTDDEPLAADN